LRLPAHAKKAANRHARAPHPRYGYLSSAAGLRVLLRAYWFLETNQSNKSDTMKNIIDVALDAANFRVLLSAFKAASLIDMLRSPGQYTVFAPTDEAFRRLPAGSLDALFKDARTLKPFLCNHIMKGLVAANDILPGELKPMEGRTLRATLDGSRININGATIVQSDIRATNGVVHAIDDVLIPLNPILAAVA
jgi:uncharacterized surface protein with fasciclin (FAS1) repeats